MIGEAWYNPVKIFFILPNDSDGPIDVLKRR